MNRKTAAAFAQIAIFPTHTRTSIHTIHTHSQTIALFEWQTDENTILIYFKSAQFGL